MGKTQLVILVIFILLFIGYFMFTKPDPELAGNNKQAGEAFLAENAEKDGVITTASGLQYTILTAGEGEKPTASSSVTVHYKGTTLDDKEFVVKGNDELSMLSRAINRMQRSLGSAMTMLNETIDK